MERISKKEQGTRNKWGEQPLVACKDKARFGIGESGAWGLPVFELGNDWNEIPPRTKVDPFSAFSCLKTNSGEVKFWLGQTLQSISDSEPFSTIPSPA
jgi:hypothetical protein